MLPWCYCLFYCTLKASVQYELSESATEAAWKWRLVPGQEILLHTKARFQQICPPSEATGQIILTHCLCVGRNKEEVYSQTDKGGLHLKYVHKLPASPLKSYWQTNEHTAYLFQFDGHFIAQASPKRVNSSVGHTYAHGDKMVKVTPGMTIKERLIGWGKKSVLRCIAVCMWKNLY